MFDKMDADLMEDLLCSKDLEMVETKEGAENMELSSVSDPSTQQYSETHQEKESSQRSCSMGLETCSELVWEYWDLGKKFTKTIVLKNIGNKLHRLHLRTPLSQFFTIVKPRIIVLSPGTSVFLPITFIPQQRCEYEDSVEFHCKEGSLPVRLHATIPRHGLEVPHSVPLPLCAVQDSLHTTFCIKNAGELQTSFQWECAAPFLLNPEQGLLEPGQECQITVVFQPQEALVYRQQAHCWYGGDGDEEKSCCSVLLQGTAKYPCLQLTNPATTEESEHGIPVLAFGSVFAGHNLKKHFHIFNPTPVTAPFTLSRLSGGVSLLGTDFRCDVTKGKVAPGEMLRVTVTYCPTKVGKVSVENLSLKCIGALKEDLLKLIGRCIGPKVSLSSSVVNFGCVKEGGSSTRTVELHNSSPAETIYQWDLDCNGHSVFSIQPPCGTVQPNGHISLKAVYRPTHPIAHHRRVACLMRHGDPLFLDLIGTCHSQLRQPAILKPEHLALTKLYWYGAEKPPETLSGVQQDHSVQPDQQDVHGALKETSKSLESGGVLLKTAMEELFFSSSSASPVSVVPAELLFNHRIHPFIQSNSSTASKAITITNRTGRKLSLIWTVAKDSPFTVGPVSCDLAALKSTSFRVTYIPTQLNTFHGAQLECFAVYTMDEHGSGKRCPPWCVTVRVVGQSFEHSRDLFFPSPTLSPSHVVFPGLGAVCYQKVLLRNVGDTPLTFCVDYSSNPTLAESIPVIPKCGLIQPRHHHILTVKTTPTEDNPKQGVSLKLQFNGSKDSKELTVVSVVEKLSMSMEGDGNLYFQTTAVGSETQCSHHIRNLSSLPLWYQWSISEPDKELISVQPDAGELNPNELSFQTWTFSPQAEKTYTLTPILTFWPNQSDGRDVSHLSLSVVGMGAKGIIEAKTAVLDVEETLVGSSHSAEIPLVNNSPCSVSFSLSVQQMLLDEELVHDPETEPCALQLDCERETIASHSTMLLRSTFRPYKPAHYLWKISYQTLNASGSASSRPQALCEVQAKGGYPTLQVTDVCSGGGLGRLGKEYLWTLLSLDSLNKHLLSNPSAEELTCVTPTNHSSPSCPSIFTSTIVDFNFGAAILKSDPSTFELMFHNPGSIPVNWAFLFPEDQPTEPESKAETEASQMRVQDQKFFSISPRSGTLLSGQHMAVHFTYSHDVVGTHHFPIIFKISYGRQILFNLLGETLTKNKPYLHCASTTHVFSPVSIWDRSPPRQQFELHNAGEVPVHYEVDTNVLLQLQEENYNHPVVCCLNPEGEVAVGKTAILEWVFSPLEAKMYEMEIPIYIQGGDTILVRFNVSGVVAPTLGSSKEEESEASVQRIPFPEQLVFLSEDSVSLGDIPVCSLSSRIVFLTNLSHTDAVQYTWYQTQQCEQEVVQISPKRGRLCPGESGLCILTFTSTDYPTIYRQDLVCEVIQEKTLTQYRMDLQFWEEEQKRQQEEFTIMEKDIFDPVAASKRKEQRFRKYKTLPPIYPTSSPETDKYICKLKAERRALQEAAKLQRQPEAPKSTLLHLEVTAHSHGLRDYFTHFPAHYNRLYSYSQLVKPEKSDSAPSSTSCHAGPSPSTRGPEKDLSVDTLSALFWDILSDSDFVRSLIALASKPIPHEPRATTPSYRPPAYPASAHSTRKPQPPPHLRGAQAELKRGHSRVDRRGTAAHTLDTRNTVPADINEDVLLNTIQNLAMEAVREEFVLTAHPRNIALPLAYTSITDV